MHGVRVEVRKQLARVCSRYHVCAWVQTQVLRFSGQILQSLDRRFCCQYDHLFTFRAYPSLYSHKLLFPLIFCPCFDLNLHFLVLENFVCESHIYLLSTPLSPFSKSSCVPSLLFQIMEDAWMDGKN